MKRRNGMMMASDKRIVQVTIDKAAYGGRGLGKVDGCVAFVSGAVPGDKVSARIIKKKSNYIEAETIDIIEPSPDRISPECPLFGACGGCSWQNLAYESQLKWKEDIALSALSHIGGAGNFSTGQIIPSPEIWRYRNKMDFTFGRNSKGEFAVGMHKKGSFHEIVDVEKCLICPESFEKVLAITKAHCIERDFAPYNPKNHEGLMRHLIVRAAKNTNETIAILLTTSENFEGAEELYQRLTSEIPNFKGLVWGLNAGVADAPNADKIIREFGENCFIEKLGDIKLMVSAFSFMQTNTLGAEKLYGVVRDYLELEANDIIFDAYCGAGSIGLFVAGNKNQVFGIDIVKSAIWDARRNAQINNITKSTFIAGEMKKTIPLMLQASPDKITRLIVDPPRGGMDKKSLKQIIDINAPILVYVSCNPTTLARDLEIISEGGYEIRKAQPVDMFPHTYHIELVAQFVKVR